MHLLRHIELMSLCMTLAIGSREKTMIDSETLRDIIKEIFKIDEKYIIPINMNWFFPIVDTQDVDCTYIGYRIIQKKMVPAESQFNENKKDFIRISFRLTFIGKNAEKISDQIHFWKDIDDVNKVFKKYKVELNYNSMESFTYPMKDSSWPMAWVFDMSVSSDYNEELKLYRKQPAKLLAGKLKDIFKKKGGK